MDELDPATAASLEDLTACLNHIHLLADKPTYRALEQQTARKSGFLPGTRLNRVRLTRTIVSDVLLGRKFPGKAFLLTFVDACGIDLENDRRWEQAWDRLAVQDQQAAARAGEAEKLRQENEELRRQLAAAEYRVEAAQAQADRATAAFHLCEAALEQSRREALPASGRLSSPDTTTTRAGLPRRVPGANLVPGPIGAGRRGGSRSSRQVGG